MKRIGILAFTLFFVIAGCGETSTETADNSTETIAPEADQQELALAELSFEVHQAPG